MNNKKIFGKARLAWIKLQDVDTRDRTFAVSWPDERNVDALAAEIETSGVVTPVWVRKNEKGPGYRLIDGFRRAAAARRVGLEEIAAELLSKDIGPTELFRARLAGQGSRLSAVEAAKALEKLETLFGLGENTLIKTFLPLVGLGQSKHLLDRCRSLKALEEPVARYCAEAQVGLAEAAIWAEFPRKGQRAILVYVSALRPGGNLLKNYLRLLGEIVLRQETTVEKILQDRVLRKLLLDPQTARSSGRELMHRRLHELRFPLMKGIEDRFDTIRRKLGLPSEILLRPPPLFEGDRLRISFEIEGPGDLADKARLLLEVAQSADLEELFRCLGAPSTEDRHTGGGTR